MAFVGLTKLGEDVPRLTPLSFKEKFNTFVDETQKKVNDFCQEHKSLIQFISTIALMTLSTVGIASYFALFLFSPSNSLIFTHICVIYIPSLCGLVASISSLFDLIA